MKNIKYQLTISSTPQQNIIMEMKTKTLLGMARLMMDKLI